MKLMLNRREAVALGLAVFAPWADAATPRGTLVIAKNIEDVLTLDPAEAFEHNGAEITANAYSKLMRPDPRDPTRSIGDAAQSWQRSSDGKTFTFTLRAGQKFPSGRAVTAHDAAYSLRRVVLLNKTPAFLLNMFGWTKANVEERVQALDQERVVLHLSEPMSPDLVLQVMSCSVASVMDSELLRANEKAGDFGNGWVRTNWAGSGRFKVVSWKAKEAIVLEANPSYYQGREKLDRVILRHVPESSAQALLIGKGDVDIAKNLQPDQIRLLAKVDEVVVERRPVLTQIYIPLNQKVAALTHPKVREALRWSIDYEGIRRNLLDGQWLVHQSMIGAGSLGALTDNPYRLDVARARRLLAEAGYADGLAISMDVENGGPYPDIAQALQANFHQVGIRLNLVSADRRQVLTKYRARSHETILWHSSPSFNDPHSAALDYACGDDIGDSAKLKNRAWRSNWVAGDLNQLTQAAMVESDPEKRRQLYVEMQRRIRQDGPYLFLFQEMEEIVRRRDVKGYVAPSPYEATSYAGIYKS